MNEPYLTVAHFGTLPFDHKGRCLALTYGFTRDTDAITLDLDDVTDPERPVAVLSGGKTENGDLLLRIPAKSGSASASPQYVDLDLVEDFIGWMKSEL
ncbi:MAG: hypothetical protein AAFN13_13245 [Bacteroidota bacterium]